jgi:hypothetical protein
MVFKTRPKHKFLLLVPVIFLLISALPSLSTAVETCQVTAQSIRRSVEMDALKKALKAFDAGDYEKAQTGFEMLGHLAKNPDIRRDALYGLASTRLILADSKDAFDSAVAEWKKWADQAGSTKGMEDPRMLTPFLLRLQCAVKKGGGGVLGEKAKGDCRPRIVITSEKVIQVLRAKLEFAERQVRRLRHDLKSLDEIHRKYEEKKQEMAQ